MCPDEIFYEIFLESTRKCFIDLEDFTAGWVVLSRKVRLEKIVEVKICYSNRSLKFNEKWCTYLREKWNALNIFHSFLLRVGKNSYFIGQKYSKYSESNTTDKVHNTKNLISTISWFIARKYSSKSNLCIPKENDKSFLEYFWSKLLNSN